MKNKGQKIIILDGDSGSDKVKVKFIESNTVMLISDAILNAKVNAGFYTVVNPAV